MAASCPSQLDDDHIATGRCPSRTGHSRRDRPQTARQPTVSRGAHYRQDPTPWAHHDSQQQSYKPFADLWTGEERAEWELLPRISPAPEPLDGRVRLRHPASRYALRRVDAVQREAGCPP